MRQAFPGFYEPTQQEFEELWKAAVFAFDANVFLNLYRYTARTRSQILKIAEHLKDRIWIPHQAALEYQRNRLTVALVSYGAYRKVGEFVASAVNQFSKDVRAHCNTHEFIDPAPLTELLEQAAEEIKKKLGEIESKVPEPLSQDLIRDQLDKLFDGHVGPEYTEARLADVYQHAKDRFASKIPPGFKDADKDGVRAFGDVVLWFQLIDFCDSKKKPIIFVTADAKDDWWEKVGTRVIGPRPELRQEMHQKTGMAFWAYPIDRFMHYAEKHLTLTAQKDSIREVQKVRKKSEVPSYRVTEMVPLSPLAGLGSIRALEMNPLEPYQTSLSQLSKIGMNPLEQYQNAFLQAPKSLIEQYQNAFVQVPRTLIEQYQNATSNAASALFNAGRISGSPLGLALGSVGKVEKELKVEKEPRDEKPAGPENRGNDVVSKDKEDDPKKK